MITEMSMTNKFNGQIPMSMPHQVEFQYGLKPYRHFSKFSTISKYEQFLSKKTVGHLTCQQKDVYKDIDSDEEEPTYVYAMKFSPVKGLQNYLAVANEEGRLIIQDTSKVGDSSNVVAFEAHHNAIFDVSWKPDQNASNLQLATASGDQSVKVFEIISSEDVKLLHTLRGYTRSVKCVEYAPDNPNLLATGSRENTIYLWDLRVKHTSDIEPKPDIKICGAHTHTSSGAPSGPNRSAKKSTGLASSITAIQFQDEYNLISCSDTDGLVKVWDLRKGYSAYKGDPKSKYTIPYPGKSPLHGYSSLTMNSTRTHLYASCKDNHIYQFDMASYNEKAVRSFKGYENGGNSKFFIRMSLSYDDNYLACGSSDQYAYIWNTSPYGPEEPIYRLTGHESDVTCVEWSKFSWKLATCSDDMMHRIWRIQPKDPSQQEFIHGQAELMDSVQYPTKESFLVTSFDKANKIDDECDSDNSNAAKKRRIRSPLKELPQRFSMLQSPNSQSQTQESPRKLKKFPSICDSKTMMSPRKSLVSPSPRKILISPRKFMSPTASMPNFLVNGKSPHLPSRSTGKKQACGWPIQWKKRVKPDENLPKKTLLKGKRIVKAPVAKKDLTKSLQECTESSGKTPTKKRKK